MKISFCFLFLLHMNNIIKRGCFSSLLKMWHNIFGIKKHWCKSPPNLFEPTVIGWVWFPHHRTFTLQSHFSLYESKNKKLTSKEIENSFAGNICRCTGYRPIADAFKSFATDADQRLLDKIFDLEDLSILKQCGVKCVKQCPHKNAKNVEDENDFTFVNENKMIEVEYGTQRTWYRAYSLDDVFKAMANGDYKLIAGNTGQGKSVMIDR